MKKCEQEQRTLIKVLWKRKQNEARGSGMIWWKY